MRDLLSYCRSILSALHGYGFPEAIVAGGAIRDLDNGKEDAVKDIDIVVFDRPGYLRGLKRAFAGFDHRVAVREAVANYLEFENVRCVHEFWEGDSLTIQVIVTKTPRSPMDILERHDFGICQIGFDGTSILKTEAYRNDKAKKRFTLVRCRDDKDFARSAGRFDRLVQKYPGWKLCVL